MKDYIGWVDENRKWGSPLGVVKTVDGMRPIYGDGTMTGAVDERYIKGMKQVTIRVTPKPGFTDVEVLE